MGHADGLGALGLTGVDGDDAAADGLRHVSAGVDGHDEDGGHPDVVEPQGVIREIGQAIDDEHRLQHHGGAAEHFHIDADQHPDELQEEPLGEGVVFRVGDGVQDTADEAYHAADSSGHQGQDQRVFNAAHVHGPVFAPQQNDVLTQFHQLIHRVSSFRLNGCILRPCLQGRRTRGIKERERVCIRPRAGWRWPGPSGC